MQLKKIANGFSTRMLLVIINLVTLSVFLCCILWRRDRVDPPQHVPHVHAVELETLERDEWKKPKIADLIKQVRETRTH